MASFTVSEQLVCDIKSSGGKIESNAEAHNQVVGNFVTYAILGTRQISSSIRLQAIHHHGSRCSKANWYDFLHNTTLNCVLNIQLF
jgi:hypothetical protein